MEQTQPLTPSYLEEDASRHVLGCAILFLIVPTICFTAFIGQRCRGKAETGLKTWVLVSAAYLTLITLSIVVLLSATIGGVGRHTAYWQAENPVVIVRYSKLAVAHKYLWVGAMASSKITMCAFCLRDFSSRSARVAAWTVIGLMSTQFAAITLTNSLICRPFAYQWNQRLDGTCGNVLAFYSFSDLSEVLSDMAVLAVLATLVLCTVVGRTRYFIMSLTFLVVSLGVAIGIAHTIIAFKNNIYSDAMYTSATVMPLTLAEGCAWFIGACLLGVSPPSSSETQRSSNRKKRTPPRLPGIRKSDISSPVRDSVVSSIKTSVPSTPTVMVIYEGQISSWRIVDFDESREQSVYGSIHGSVHELV